jgi:HlyD family secretion protein
MRRPHFLLFAVAGLAVAAAAGGGIAAWRWSGEDDTPSQRQRSPSNVPGSVSAAAHRPAIATAKMTWITGPNAKVQQVSGNQELRTTSQPAHIEPYEQSAIYAKAAGFVNKVHVDLGSRVKKGDPLAELWIPEMEQERNQKLATVEEAQASVGQSEAAVVAAEALVTAAIAKVGESKSLVMRYEAELAFRQSEHARISDLVRSKAVEPRLQDESLKQQISAESALAAARAGVASAEANVKVEQARWDEARANVILAKARRKVAEAEVKRINVLVDYAVIRAPYDGVVTERLVHTGDFAQSATDGKTGPLFMMMRPDPLRIIADIPEADAAWMELGLEAKLTVDDLEGGSFAGTVKRLSDRLDPMTRTLRIEVELTDPTAGLRCGMYGKLEIAASRTLRAESRLDTSSR